MNTANENISAAEMSISVLELLRVGHEYCLFAENADQKNPQQIFDFFRKLGPLLYLKGAMLPLVEPDFPEADERFVTEEEWQAVFNEFRSSLGSLDEFYHVDHENGVDYEAIKASLSENFADIYQDLKDFLLLYQKNTRDARQNAVHDCQALFESRWGIKILENLRYVHFQMNKERIEGEDGY
jgi:hypothetical protein